MSIRRVLTGVAIAGLASLGIVGIPATSALAQACTTQCHFAFFTGDGATQPLAQAAVDKMIANAGCDLYGPDHYFMHGTGWADTHEAICPGPA